MRIPVVYKRFRVTRPCSVLARVTRAISDQEDLVILSSRGREIYYSTDYSTFRETTGLVVKSTRHTFIARVSVVESPSAMEIRFSVLAGVPGLFGFLTLIVAFLGAPVLILRAIIWLTDDLADRIAGAVIVPIFIGAGVWSVRFFGKRVSEEIRALYRPVEEILGEYPG